MVLGSFPLLLLFVFSFFSLCLLSLFLDNGVLPELPGAICGLGEISSGLICLHGGRANSRDSTMESSQRHQEGSIQSNSLSPSLPLTSCSLLPVSSPPPRHCDPADCYYYLFGFGGWICINGTVDVEQWISSIAFSALSSSSSPGTPLMATTPLLTVTTPLRWITCLPWGGNIESGKKKG